MLRTVGVCCEVDNGTHGAAVGRRDRVRLHVDGVLREGLEARDDVRGRRRVVSRQIERSPPVVTSHAQHNTLHVRQRTSADTQVLNRASDLIFYY